MRTLRFIVNGQVITKDPDCDFDGLVPGSGGVLEASFEFSPDWASMTKVAAFWSPLGREYPPQKLVKGHVCTIPAEALDRRSFKIQIIGMDANSKKLTTNKIEIIQNGGKV